MNTTHEAEDLHFLRAAIHLSGEAERRGNLPIGTAIAMAITSQPQHAGFPLTLELESSSLPKRSWIKISQIRTLSVERIGDLIGRCHRKSSASQSTA